MAINPPTGLEEPNPTPPPSVPPQTMPPITGMKPLTPPPTPAPYQTAMPEYDFSKNPYQTQDQSITSRLTGMMAQNTPLMQQARTQGMQAANRRGLLNTSMAVGEAQKAAYNAALPIATQEAGWAATTNQEQQKDINTALMNQWNAQLNRSATELASQRGEETEVQKSYLAQQEQAQKDIASMDRQLVDSMGAMERQRLVSDTTMQDRKASGLSQIVSDTAKLKNDIMLSQNMSGANKTAAITAIDNNARAQVMALNAVTKIGSTLTWPTIQTAPPKPSEADSATWKGKDGTWHGKTWNGQTYAEAVIPPKPPDKTEGGKKISHAWDPTSGNWVAGTIPAQTSGSFLGRVMNSVTQGNPELWKY